jgi:hypothetical protein
LPEKQMKTLTVPPAALRDDQAVEMLRVWVAEKALHCSVRVGVYAKEGIEKETFAWGMMLADAMQHVADALSSEGYGDREEILGGVIKGFEAEIGSPTSRRDGEFIADPN